LKTDSNRENLTIILSTFGNSPPRIPKNKENKLTKSSRFVKFYKTIRRLPNVKFCIRTSTQLIFSNEFKSGHSFKKDGFGKSHFM